MTTEEMKVLSIIWDWGGEASIDIVARAAGVSIDYARLLCESLSRGSYIDFLNFKLCRIKDKGKLTIARGRGKHPRKIVIPEKPNGFGLGKTKRGRLTLNYG